MDLLLGKYFPLSLLGSHILLLFIFEPSDSLDIQYSFNEFSYIGKHSREANLVSFIKCVCVCVVLDCANTKVDGNASNKSTNITNRLCVQHVGPECICCPLKSQSLCVSLCFF